MCPLCCVRLHSSTHRVQHCACALCSAADCMLQSVQYKLRTTDCGACAARLANSKGNFAPLWCSPFAARTTCRHPLAFETAGRQTGAAKQPNERLPGAKRRPRPRQARPPTCPVAPPAVDSGGPLSLSLCLSLSRSHSRRPLSAGCSRGTGRSLSATSSNWPLLSQPRGLFCGNGKKAPK